MHEFPKKNILKPGDLVSTQSVSKTGIVISEPEMFGFVDRVFVVWSSEDSPLEEWVNTDDLIVVSKSTEGIRND